MIDTVAGGCAALLCLVVGARIRRRTMRAAAARRIGAVDTAQAQHRYRSPIGAIGRRLERRRRARSHPERNAANVAALLDRTARHCASGVSLGQSLTDALRTSPLASAFEPTLAALAAGHTVEQALQRQPAELADIALATHVLRLCASRGGNVSESLDRAATTLRERHAAAEERHAQSSQARLSARVLTVLPLAFGGWTCVTTTSVRRFMFTSAGAACVVAGLALNIAGWMLMSRVVRGAS